MEPYLVFKGQVYAHLIKDQRLIDHGLLCVPPLRSLRPSFWTGKSGKPGNLLPASRDLDRKEHFMAFLLLSSLRMDRRKQVRTSALAEVKKVAQGPERERAQGPEWWHWAGGELPRDRRFRGLSRWRTRRRRP